MSTTNTKYAHWNSFGGFMTQKSQRQSAFFRLPRELRDLIYEHYVFEEDGLLYDPKTREMFCRSSTPGTMTRPEDSLPRTCRQATEEMKGITWRTNVVHFGTMLSLDDGNGYSGVKSKAGRLKCCN
jgi:hypothetical protein